ncbi:MAG: MBL fold metallo-hydrolase, partial [Gemmiger sp.]|uniref:MBL fold metallo-hydrolase n=1 Tax=Gemmiger sp. TaxID=2049027 RepID=UPI002A7EAEA2
TMLADIMLRDSANIQMQDAEWKTRKEQRAGHGPVEPKYTVQDVEGLMKLFRPCEYGEMVQINEHIHVRFNDAGHLLGSANIEVWLKEGQTERKVLFSGDVGNKHQPILRNPTPVDEADYVVIESTYGDRLHEEVKDIVHPLAEYLQKTFDRGGNVVIPAFAVGRTQEMLYFIRQIKAAHLVHGHEDFPVYVDSPLASKSTTIFRENFMDCYDEEALALVQAGQNPLSFPGLHISETKEDSVAINMDTVPKVILSASGMCDAGRIRHHLKHNLWRGECTVLFVGFQSPGTLGRALLEGADEVRLFGETVQVNAQIRQMTGLSGHADREGLLRWIRHFDPKPRHVFVNHGEDHVAEGFARELMAEGIPAEAPYNGAVYELSGGKVTLLRQGNTVPLASPEPSEAAKPRTSAAFERLVNMGKRLMVVIEHNRGGANKDLARFASQIASLCDKWDR